MSFIVILVCLIKRRSVWYRRTLLDIWGSSFIYLKKFNAISFVIQLKEKYRQLRREFNKEFVYNLKKKVGLKKKKRLKKKYIEPRYLYNFYLVLSRRKFKQYYLKAKNIGGFLIRNYLLYLEGRIFMILYRSNFITNIFCIKSIINLRLFLVNNKVISNVNYNLFIGDMLCIKEKYSKLIKEDIKLRIKKGIIRLNPPLYMYINYKFMFILLVRKPKLKEIYFPIRLDIYWGLDYYL